MTMRRAFRNRGREGFVLGFVVLMLFAISVAGATGYLMVSNEFSMSKFGSEQAEAVTVARAGLQRFVAEQIGVVGDSVSYAIGDGIATITSVRLSAKDSLTDLYYIQSEATVSDVFASQAPATSVVGAYAWHHRRPLAHHATVTITSANVWVRNFGGSLDGEVWGIDSSTVADCPGGGASTITGVVARQGVFGTADITGSPDGETWGSYSAIYDSVGLRWDVLQDPNFPVEFEDAMPNFAALPPDSFPVVRFNGNATFGSAHSGRGVLIVTGRILAWYGFEWDGIILAGSVYAHVVGDTRGLFVGGLDGNNPYSTIYWWGSGLYYSCNVYAANESLSYLELIGNTLFEVSGT